MLVKTKVVGSVQSPFVTKTINWAKAIYEDKTFLFSCLFLLFLFIISITGITPHDPFYQNYSNVLDKPSSAHWMGTDNLGRDLLSRIIVGGKSVFFVAFLSIVAPVVFGVPVGVISGYFGGFVDEVVMRLVDAFLSISAALLALAIICALGPGLFNATVAIGIIYIPRMIRLVRGQVLKLCEEPFIEAARAIGASNIRIMLVHILPGIIPLVVVQSSLFMGTALTIEAGLSFIGFGAQAPEISWGQMLRNGFGYLRLSPTLAVFPGVMLSLAILFFNFFGDGMRKVLDKKVK